ncbi:HNH endonuclease, partial [Escherichia coli]
MNGMLHLDTSSIFVFSLSFNNSMFCLFNRLEMTIVPVLSNVMYPPSKAALVASHIKPWKDCNDKERIDFYNGLLLCPA